jgi:hypothetical protein
VKKIVLGCISVLAVLSLFPDASVTSAYARKPTRVEVLYLNHGPLRDTLDRMKRIFSTYGDRISVAWYDFESKEGADFKVKKGINQHVPLVIWIDDSEVVKLGQKEITFVGFPTGAGPGFFQGKWTMDDLKMALDQSTAAK